MSKTEHKFATSKAVGMYTGKEAHLDKKLCMKHSQALTWNLDRMSKCFFMSVPKTC